MASFKDLKEKLQGKKTTPLKAKTNKVSDTTEDLVFGLEEARYLLALIAKSDFSGKDIQIIYNVALKLQNVIKSHIKEEDGKD
mgnify:FL=1|tara:strand:- start:8384 stop:8632 length:249 start_codon:yes stop_codon:yes gene_type:complete